MGKTKDIRDNGDGTVRFVFKDDVCTDENGKFDPGANKTGLKIDGMGRAAMMLSQHFFPILEKECIPTHFNCVDAEAGTMNCDQLEMIPLEFVWRDKAWGSFCKMYGVKQGLPLGSIIEMMLKSDELGDPRINFDAANAISLITRYIYEGCVDITRQIGIILRRELFKYDYELIDFKVEFGFDIRGQLKLADEISGGIWRILDKNGNTVDPVVAAKKICGY